MRDGVFVCWFVRWMADIYLARNGKPLEDNYQLLHGSKQSCPQQQNNKDCGVFLCTTANFISQDLPLTVRLISLLAFRSDIASYFSVWWSISCYTVYLSRYEYHAVQDGPVLSTWPYYVT